MKKLFFAFVLLCLFSSISFAQKIIKTQQKGQALFVKMELDGLEREFIIHFPKGYKRSDKKLPAVFMFHGGGGNGEKFYRTSGWKELGNKKHFLSIYPSALSTCIIKDGQASTKTYWMTSSKLASLCKGQSPRDDTRFIKAMIKYISQKHRADRRRIYSAGFSNGLGLSLDQNMPKLSKYFAAIGGVGSLIQDVISIKTPLPTFVMIGQKDDRFTIRNNNKAFPMGAKAIQKNAFLSDMISNLNTSLNLNGSPSIKKGPKFTKLHYTNKTKKGNQELHFAILKGLSHKWPNGKAKVNGVNAPEILWDFFQQFSK